MTAYGPTVALIVAAGRGTRAAANGTGPKQYTHIGGRAVLAHALLPFLSHSKVQNVCVVIHPDDLRAYDAAVAPLAPHTKLLQPAFGGRTRQQSVLFGLEAVSGAAPSSVLIHDAARPFLTGAVIDRVLEALDDASGAIAAIPLTDTLKRAAENDLIAETVARQGLWRAQTPQAFRYSAILAAHRAAELANRADFADDAAVAEWNGVPVRLVLGDIANTKLTTLEDIRMAEASFVVPRQPDMRVGQGFDVHRFVSGDHVWLCGIRVPHTHSVEAHSDGDVALHALTDALLGAIADGDIGIHFQNNDPNWRGASSDRFLADAVARVTANGGEIVNVDVTVMCEAPKISPYRDAMRLRLSEILGVPLTRIGLKATTTERMGFTGRREGLAAMAIALVHFAQK